MADFETVRYDLNGAVATVSMNRPDALNAFNSALRKDLAGALTLAGGDNKVRAVLLKGEGRLFGAGADLTSDVTDDTYTMLMEEWRPSLRQITQMPKPVIAVVQGAAAGIHISFAMACDLAIMADDARLVTPFSNIGLIPDGGANWLLLRQLGYKRAFRIAVESQILCAAEALEMGLVNRVVPLDQLDSEADAWAAELAARAPLAIAGIKKVMRLSENVGFEEAYEAESRIQGEVSTSEDTQEGVDAFLNKREANFIGR